LATVLHVETQPYVEGLRLIPDFPRGGIRLLTAHERSARPREASDWQLASIQHLRTVATDGNPEPTLSIKPFGHGHDLVYDPATGRIVEFDFALGISAPPTRNVAWGRPQGRTGLGLATRSQHASGHSLSSVAVSAYVVGGAIVVDFGLADSTPSVWKLSEKCDVAIDGNRLLGFLLNPSCAGRTPALGD